VRRKTVALVEVKLHFTQSSLAVIAGRGVTGSSVDYSTVRITSYSSLKNMYCCLGNVEKSDR
jgi:hypothetical protein